MGKKIWTVAIPIGLICSLILWALIFWAAGLIW